MSSLQLGKRILETYQIPDVGSCNRTLMFILTFQCVDMEKELQPCKHLYFYICPWMYCKSYMVLCCVKELYDCSLVAKHNNNFMNETATVWFTVSRQALTDYPRMRACWKNPHNCYCKASEKIWGGEPSSNRTDLTSAKIVLWVVLIWRRESSCTPKSLNQLVERRASQQNSSTRTCFYAMLGKHWKASCSQHFSVSF